MEKGDSLAGRNKIYLLGGKRLSGLDEGDLLVGRKTRRGRPNPSLNQFLNHKGATRTVLASPGLLKTYW